VTASGKADAGVVEGAETQLASSKAVRADSAYRGFRGMVIPDRRKLLEFNLHPFDL
jgi:hypothetical protein